MPVIWLRAAIRHSRYHRHLGRLQVEALCSSSAAPTDSHIVRLILDQKSASEALRTFRWASNLPNFSHSQSTYRALIHKLCSFLRFDAVKDLLDEMPRSLGSPPDDDTFITLIRGLGRAGMVRRVLKVPDIVSKFHGNTMPSVKIFNSVLNVLVKENIDLARDFYRNHMMASGVQGDDYTFGILMKGLCSTNRIADAFKLLQLIKSRGITPNAVIYNTLLHALCKNGSVGRARSLMNDMDEPSDVTFNILISAYCAERNLVQAFVLLEKCFSSGFLPDIVTVTKVLEVLCELGRVSEAVKILERVESAGGTVDVMAHNTLIKGFCQLGKPKVGHQIVKEMESKGCLPNVDTYNVLISGFCKSGMLESAVDLFNEMKTDGIKWNFDTYDVLIRGLCLGGQTKDGLEILQLMEESKDGCGGRISPYNSILYGFYNENRTDEGLEFLKNLERLFPDVVDKSLKILDLCKEGKTKDAKSIYDQMISKGRAPSAFVYGHLVSGFCQEGCLREALELTNEMIGCGYSPIASTLNSLIREFYSQGRSDSAIKLMEDMVGRGFVLDAGSYIPVLHALCRDGDFEKALKIFSQMEDKGIVPDCFSWNSLLLCLSQETEWLGKNHKVEVNKKLEYIMESC